MAYNSANDPYSSRTSEISTQARATAAIVPSDSADLPTYAKALMVTQAGTLSILPIVNYESGSTTAVPLGTLPVGYIVPIQVARVFATGTTATVIGLYN